MNRIKLISDSTCDLSPELRKMHDIDVVPLYVNFKEQSFFDGENLSTQQMYDLIKTVGYLPKTAAVAPGTFATVFKSYLDQGDQILFMGIGSKFSATLQSAYVAKQLLKSDDICLIDSGNLSSGTGLLLLKAAKFRAEGDDLDTIEKKILEIIPKVRTQFVIDTMEYLYKGGRCNSLVAFMGTFLKIKPIIKVREGSMVVGKKGHGKITSGIDLLIEEARANKEQIDPDFMMVTDSVAPESVQYIMDRISDLGIKNIYHTDAGCVISSHCGQGCIGILYIMK